MPTISERISRGRFVSMEPLPHLTCAANRRAELVTLIERYRRGGVENLLALHGDPPLAAIEVLPEGELRYALARAPGA